MLPVVLPSCAPASRPCAHTTYIHALAFPRLQIVSQGKVTTFFYENQLQH